MLPLPDGNHILAPNNAITFSTWERFLSGSDGEGVNELRTFLKLRDGASTFIDIGSAEGLFSAVFAQTAKTPGTIHAIEPMQKFAQVNAKTREANAGCCDWQIHNMLLGDKDGDIRLDDTIFYGLFSAHSKLAVLNQPTTIMRLETFCANLNIIPDLVKIDTESFEHEIITGSLAFLKATKPRIHLEMHSAMLRERGLNPESLLDRLMDIYDVLDGVSRKKLLAPHIVRFGLVPKAR